ncbi:MAG: ornithine cyclodeaminase family protein [Thermoleophilia bacterium]|nr:ornithine cyclodeaminase family protein [Thermoleophilia bacterium]
MTLLLDNDDVRAVLRMDACIDALETAFRDYARGRAVNRPRSHTYTDLGGGRHYLLKTMDGSLATAGVHALRLTSDLTYENGRRREKLPAAPGGRYVGLVLLFDVATLVPLAIVHDGELQRMRVGATSALAARHLARRGARVAGIVGTGWQAAAQVAGLREVFELEEIRVYAPTEEKLERFAREHAGTAVGSAREAIAGADVVALATNAYEPVLDARWLEPGQHVGSLQGHELDEATLERADLVVVRSREEATFHFAPGHAPRAAAERKRLDRVSPTRVVELGEVVTRAAGRGSDDDITLFTGGGTGASSGLGIQFAAVAHVVYEAARAAGRGRELPTEWFTQREKT